MSVLKANRGESPVQFLDTARQLEVYTIRNCLKFPKRYTFFITTEIVALAQQVYDGVKSANSIYPATKDDVAKRREYFTAANCSLQCLVSQLDVVKELFGSTIEDKTWVRWMGLIADEARLIANIKKSDAQRI